MIKIQFNIPGTCEYRPAKEVVEELISHLDNVIRSDYKWTKNAIFKQMQQKQIVFMFGFEQLTRTDRPFKKYLNSVDDEYAGWVNSIVKEATIIIFKSEK